MKEHNKESLTLSIKDSMMEQANINSDDINKEYKEV